MLHNTYSLLPQERQYHTKTVAIAIQKAEHAQWVAKQERKAKRKAFFKQLFNPSSSEQKMEI